MFRVDIFSTGVRNFTDYIRAYESLKLARGSFAAATRFEVYIPPKGSLPCPGMQYKKVEIPEMCPTCAKNGVMSLGTLLSPGSPSDFGSYVFECEHLWTWDRVWDILENNSDPSTQKSKAAPVTNKLHDTRCKHCDEPNPYIEAGPEGYTCYSCRQSGRR